MKKILLIGSMVVASLVMSGCDVADDATDGDADDVGNYVSGTTYDAVYLDDLYMGFVISGYNNKGENVALSFCDNSYTYSRAKSQTESFYGTFRIDGNEVEMTDKTSAGGSYVLNGRSGSLETGYTYDCNALSRDLTVEAITKVDCSY